MITTINPANGEVLANYNELSDEEVLERIELANSAFLSWRSSSFALRSELMLKLASILDSRKAEFAKQITLEMGKPISQSIEEIDKCISTARYYAENLNSLLAPESYPTKYSESFITFEPIGIVLAIMPWNFPFWQALRAAFPTILAGNVLILKHASSVQGAAASIEKLFLEAGFPTGVFTNLCISSSKVESIIRNPLIRAVTLTGSEEVGSKVAAIAGSEIKKTVMELGGSDPFIVLSDADIEFACEAAKKSRLRNSGQACTAAKRFIVVKEIYEDFLQKLISLYQNTKVGDPLDETTEVGPLASSSALENIQKQIESSLASGAKLEFGGNRVGERGFFLEPTILSNVKPGMVAFDEEIFGPVASVILAENTEHAIELANQHKYGLAASLWSSNINLAKSLIPKIEAGSVFINSIVSSEITMPFGGIKKSGYGRELSAYGIKEFMNVKTIIVK